MTMQELVDCLMSHPLYQEGKAADTRVVLILHHPETGLPYFNGQDTVQSITALTSKQTNAVHLGLRVGQD